MRRSIGMGLAFATTLAIPALGGDGVASGRVHHRHAYSYAHRVVHPGAIAPNGTAPASAQAPILFPGARPYPTGEGDGDGLSRHIGDCNKGCIGGNPG